MFVTKHAAELCALLVNDLYGELPSRILAALLTKGRSTMTQLGQYTQLGPRNIRNGLGVLIQQNLLYYHTDHETKRTTYDANADACYCLIRSGKILEMMERQYGTAERDLVQTLMLLGYTRIAELTHAYESRAPKTNGHNGHTNGANGSSSYLIQSESELHGVLARLIRAEIVEAVRPASFRNPREVYQEIEQEVTKTAPGEKSSKSKIEQQQQILEQYRTFRDQSKSLKRQLDQFGGPVSKRRKLQGEHSRHSDDDDMPALNPNVVVRINYEKCLVELRNQRLAEFASDTLGGVTGEIYRLVLELLTAEFSRCRVDPLLGDEPQPQAVVSTMEIYEHLDGDVNVAAGIGKAPKDKIDYQSAEKVHLAPVGDDVDSDDSDVDFNGSRPGFFGGVDGDSDSDDVVTSKSRSASKTNGARPSKVKFEGSAASSDSRLDQLRQHLLLLAESKHRFIRHCGTVSRGQWTVDFQQLMERLRETELDAFIEQSCGRHGLRLTRILREKGKLDEKMLPSAALMKKADVQAKMLAMQMAGFVDVQEVPKDNSRVANRTLFFWFFDRARAQAQLLDDLYKTMVRCLEALQVERHRERNILSFVERKDVRGKEEEVMTAEHYNKYVRHLEEQKKLLGQVMKLDEVVAVFRDY